MGIIGNEGGFEEVGELLLDSDLLLQSQLGFVVLVLILVDVEPLHSSIHSLTGPLLEILGALQLLYLLVFSLLLFGSQLLGLTVGHALSRH